ncbi:MAG: Maf family protein [Pseudolabrys sp.]
MRLWTAPEALVLASKSPARRRILVHAGIAVDIHPANIDERAVEAAAEPKSPAEAALLLAHAKALAASAAMPDRMVLGADQTLALGEKRFSKPAGREAAHEQLRELSGKTHALHSAFALAQGGKILFEHGDSARLTMRALTDATIDDYLKTAGDAVLGSVGAYQIEDIGIQLFERIEGDYFTILGLPLLPLLDWLRRNGFVAA